MPSIYMPYESDCTDSPYVNNTGGCVPHAHNEAYIKAGVAEAVRISKLVTPSPPVVPYTWYRYHSEPAPDPHARELLTPRDAMLQFKFPLSLPGVKQLIIWGDEGSNATREADLKTWLATNADAFDGSRPDSLLKNVDGQGRGAAGQTTQRPAASAGNAAARPPAASVPRDGPIPPYTVCSLWT